VREPVREPALLLLAEPFAALEALTPADRVLVLEDGKIALEEAVTMARPRRPELAGFGEQRRRSPAALGADG
jgi:ABC-type nitrate/sulfonate/bicarbonate transport system ATPase subunit